MKQFAILLYFLLPVAGCLLPAAYCQQPAKKLIEYVNPFIGTGGHGHTFPGTTFPFGACQLSPDTRLSGWDGCSGYHYSDSVIYGFSHTHLSGTGCSDYGDILLMPVTKEMELDKYQYASSFSHKKEEASPGYYSVYLHDPKVYVELTSTLHGGIHKYSYPNNSAQYVVLDLKHRDEVLDSRMVKVDDYTIRGYRFSKAWAQNQKLFYEIKFSKPILEIQYEEVKTASMTSAINLQKSLHAIIKFKDNQFQNNPYSEEDQPGNDLIVKVSISGVDEMGAEANMKLEMPHWNFKKYRTEAEAEWEKELSKIQIGQFDNENATPKTGSSSDKPTIFYTALYHCMIHPSIYSDVDGRYRGRDDMIHNTEGKFDYYTVFSLWDTYRALHPLLTLLDKKRTNDFINTFISQYEQGGRLPIWELSSNETNCMIGYHVVSVIWDAYNKGIRDYDPQLAFEAMKSIATDYNDYTSTDEADNPSSGISLKKDARKRSADGDALESYIRYGYVRADDSHESVSKTLEYAYDDWCIAQMANTLRKKKDYKYYTARSHNWKNVYDPSTGFMRARKNGTLYTPFSPYTVDNNFTEANSWQYSFYVPHDVEGMIAMHEDKEKFENKLDDLFNAKTQTEGREQADITGLIGQYAHGNEPSHEIAYLYNYVDKPEKTQKIINYVLDSFYTNKPDGLIGNEDCGQMSAWYVMSAMGIYQLCPGKMKYDLSKSSFSNIKINNEKLDESLFPDKNTEPEKAAFHFTINPCIKNVQRIFKDSIKLEFDELHEDDPLFAYKSFCSIDGSSWRPIDSIRNKYFKNSFSIQFYAASVEYGSVSSCTANSGCGYESKIDTVSKTPVQNATFTKLPSGRKIILKSDYNPSYHAGGADGLMDGIFGKTNWRAGDWQGYQGQDVEVIMAFEKPKEVKSIAADFLEDQNSWIFYPKEVSFYTSDDSVHWTLVENIPTNKSDHNTETTISKFRTSGSQSTTTKFVKLIAKNFGPMPQWHEGRGEPTFIFIDELEVE